MAERALRLLRRRAVQAGLNALAGLGLLGFVAHAVPIRAAITHLRPEHAQLLVALVALVLLSQVTRAIRWRCLVSPLSPVNLGDALWVNATTQLLNYLVPVRAGEAVRLLWLSRRRGVPGATAAGVLVIDHTFDLCGVIAVLGIGMGLRVSALDPQLPAVTSLGAALAGAVLMLVAIMGTALLGPCIARYRLLPARIRDRINHPATGFRMGALAVRGRRRLAALALASAVAVALDGLAFAFLFMALGIAVPIVSAIVAQVALLYAYLLPAAPGYVGSLEAGGTLLLSGGLGLDGGVAAGAMIVWHALGALVVVGLGLVAVHQLRRTGQLTLR